MTRIEKALIVPINIRFALLAFDWLVSRRHNKSNSFQYISNRS